MQCLPTSLRTPAETANFQQNHLHATREFAARQAWDRGVDAREDARAFVAEANALVDEIEADRGGLDVVAYLRRRNPIPTSVAVATGATQSLDCFVPQARLGWFRRALFVLIGRAAFRGWRAA